MKWPVNWIRCGLIAINHNCKNSVFSFLFFCTFRGHGPYVESPRTYQHVWWTHHFGNIVIFPINHKCQFLRWWWSTSGPWAETDTPNRPMPPMTGFPKYTLNVRQFFFFFLIFECSALKRNLCPPTNIVVDPWSKAIKSHHYPEIFFPFCPH